MTEFLIGAVVFLIILAGLQMYLIGQYRQWMKDAEILLNECVDIITTSNHRSKALLAQMKTLEKLVSKIKTQ